LFLLLESTDGILADVEVFLNAGYGYDVRCEVVGEVGTALATARQPTDLRRGGAIISALPMDWIGRFGDAYRAQLQAWVDGVLRGEQCGANAWDGYAASAVADAAIASLASEKRCPVSLRRRPSLYPGPEAR
jgi:myo-inositol 2-dehydrogenase/D-chiro-inositol 1-dehydrogenase